MSLTKAERDALPDDDFAVPGKRMLPIHDARHVRMAWDMVSYTKGLTDSERAEARKRILERAHKLGIETEKWKLHALALAAESLDVPLVPDHPNRMPFTGILARLDQPSDRPLMGSNGKLVVLPRDVAEAAIPSLLGMAVDMRDTMDGHDPQQKIGVITDARIEGDALHIEGFVYKADFPMLAQSIRAEKEQLGFSYEVQASIDNPDSAQWLITACKFTGAAILYKDKAAYQSTKLAATAAAEGETMSKEILEALAAMQKDIAELKASGTAQPLAASSVHHLVKPHADKLRAAADGMEAAGMGLHPERGHVKRLRHMADKMEAEAAMGELPHIYTTDDYMAASAPAAVVDPALTDRISKLEAAIGTLTTTIENNAKEATQARLSASEPPARQTVSLPSNVRSLMARAGLEVKGDSTFTVEAVDKVLEAAGLPVAKRLEAKFALNQAGLLATA